MADTEHAMEGNEQLMVIVDEVVRRLAIPEKKPAPKVVPAPAHWIGNEED